MTNTQRRTGFVCHELYMWHNTGNYAGPMPYGNPVQPDTHAENPETKRRFRNLLEVAGLTPQLHAISPREASPILSCSASNLCSEPARVRT